jgi:hypothetical protein
MNSFHAIKEAKLPANVQGRIVVDIRREPALLDEANSAVTGFSIEDNGIGLDDHNFDSFNTAFSSNKEAIGGKGLGRFTWLKAFHLAHVCSTFLDDDGTYQTREFDFDENYDLDERGLPHPGRISARGTTIELVNLRNEQGSSPAIGGVPYPETHRTLHPRFLGARLCASHTHRLEPAAPHQ